MPPVIPDDSPHRAALDEARSLVARARTLFFLTGAGVSAESGVPTFRAGFISGIDDDAAAEDAGWMGMGEAGAVGSPSPAPHWARFRPEDLATPEAFHTDPVAVWAWYDARRAALDRCTPNAGHEAVARALERHADAHLATQNVDGLHTRASAALGAPVPHPCIQELHGSIARLCCSDPGCGWEAEDPRRVDASSLETLPRCPEVGCGHLLRPAVVWFGEVLPPVALEAAFEAASRADVCVVAGTSAVVHPAASLPLVTLRAGGVVIEVNPEPTPLSGLAAVRLPLASGVALPLVLPF